MDLFDLFAKITLDTSEYDAGLDKASSKAHSFKDSMQTLSGGISATAQAAAKGFQAVESVGKTAWSAMATGLKGFAVASTAVGGFGASAVRTGMEFDEAMSTVQALTGATGDDFTSLRDKAKEMGAETVFSASEAAEAMTYMGMAGWKTEDMLDGISGIMNLAAASGEDLATTSDIVTDALTAFGLSAKDSGHFADILAAASTNSNTNVAMMGETFKYVAPVAGALGYSAEDAAVAIGLMANSGIKASQAGTALRTALTNMASPTSNMTAVMEEYGISLTNADGSMYSLAEIMGQLREKMGGLDEATQAQAASMLFGKEAMSGMLAIINASDEDFANLTAAIYGSAGAAQQMAEVKLDNLAGDVQLLKSAFEGLQIEISDTLTASLRDFAQFGADALNQLSEGFRSGGASGMLDALSDVVAEALSLLSEKAPEFAEISVEFLEALAEGFLNSRDKLADSANAIITMLGEELNSWLSSHSGALVDAGHKIIDVITNAFSTAGDIISNHIGEFIPLIAEAFLSYHESLFTVGLDILAAIGKGLVESKDEIQEMASKTIANMVSSLRENAPDIIDGGIALLDALVGAITDNLSDITDTAAEIVSKLMAGLAQEAPKLVKSGLEIIQSLAGSITKNLPSILKSAKEIMLSLLKGITEEMPKLVDSAAEIIATLVSGLAEALPELIPAAVEMILTLAENLTSPDNIAMIIDAALQLISGLAEGLIDALPVLIEKLPIIITNIIEGLVASIPDLLMTGGQLLAAVAEGLVQGLISIPEIGANIVRGLWDGITSMIDWLKDLIGGWLGDLWDGICDFFGIASPSKEMAWVGEMMVDGLANAIDRFGGEAVRAAEAMSEDILDAARLDNVPVSFDLSEYDRLRSLGGQEIAMYGNAPSAGWEAREQANRGGNTYVTINSPVAVDAIEAAREWKKTSQRMAMGF